jgi:methanogenic corrinoid protein MtbC1
MAGATIDEAYQVAVREQDSASSRNESDGPAVETSADRERLYRTIECEIIPRLMLSQSGRTGFGRMVTDTLPGMRPTHEEMFAFCDAVLSPDDAAPMRMIAQLRARGFGLESLLLNLMTPTARRLGDLWTSDALSFTDVTVALSRMQSLVRALSIGHDHNPALDSPAVMFLPAPGEQHTFGVMMVEELFRRSGYNVATPALEQRELLHVIRKSAYDVIGFSLSCDQLMDRLTWAIHMVKSTSKNRGLKVLVGGRVFVEHPDFVRQCGADGSAIDGAHAVQTVEGILGRDSLKKMAGNASNGNRGLNGDTRQTP